MCLCCLCVSCLISCWGHFFATHMLDACIYIFFFSWLYFLYFCVALDTYIGTSKMCTNEVMIHRNQMTHSIMPIYTENNTKDTSQLDLPPPPSAWSTGNL